MVEIAFLDATLVDSSGLKWSNPKKIGKTAFHGAENRKDLSYNQSQPQSLDKTHSFTSSSESRQEGLLLVFQVTETSLESLNEVSILAIFLPQEISGFSDLKEMTIAQIAFF